MVGTALLAREPAYAVSARRGLLLPGGAAVELRATLGQGTPFERLVILDAVRVPIGVGFLVIDGPPSEMAAHAADLDRIPVLLVLE